MCKRYHYPQCGSVLVTQSCLTFSDPVDCSLPGYSVDGILQARILEWVAFSTDQTRSPALQSNSSLCQPPGKCLQCEQCSSTHKKALKQKPPASPGRRENSANRPVVSNFRFNSSLSSPICQPSWHTWQPLQSHEPIS